MKFIKKKYKEKYDGSIDYNSTVKQLPKTKKKELPGGVVAVIIILILLLFIALPIIGIINRIRYPYNPYYGGYGRNRGGLINLRLGLNNLRRKKR